MTSNPKSSNQLILPPLTPTGNYWQLSYSKYQSSDRNELAKYLVRSQLLTSELDKFDDIPEKDLS